MRSLVLLVLCIAPALAQPAWRDLLNGRNLDGWEPSGNAVWKVMRDGTLVGQHDLVTNKPEPGWSKDEYNRWLYTQAWLYTKEDFDEFDLHLDYWLRYGGNSGVSIRDASRARAAVTFPPDFAHTPAKIAYEIQLANHYSDHYPSGSLYGFQEAQAGAQVDDDWNGMDIQVRRGGIRVRVNGRLVTEHAGDPKRPVTGPIGLQLHDQYTVAMFRNIRIREVK